MQRAVENGMAAKSYSPASYTAQGSRQRKAYREISAVLRSAVSCYAFEGTYPESLSYLKEHYGVTWNEDKYVVDYETIGANLMPSVTVIPIN